MNSRHSISPFVILFFLIILPTSQPEYILRFSRFVIVLEDYRETGISKISQITFVTKIHCIQLCFHNRICLTSNFYSKICTLFSFDPRIKTGGLKNYVKATRYSLFGMSQIDNKMACIADQSEVSTRADIENKCELGGKMFDSNCSNWSFWWPSYDKKVCSGTKLYSVIFRLRTCTHALNGGTQCTGNVYEEKRKIPVLFNSDGESRNYAASRKFCLDRDLRMFTNVAIIVANESPFISQENLTNLRDWNYFIDAKNTVGVKFEIATIGPAREYFEYCSPLGLVPG